MTILYHHRTRATDAQGIHIAAMIRNFRSLGHQVEVVSIASKGPVKASAGQDDARPGKRRLPLVTELVALGYNLVGLPLVFWKLRQVGARLLYERYSLMNFSGILAGKLAGCPVVLEVNSPLALEMARDGEITLRRFARWSERTICNLADRVAVVSTPLARILTADGVHPDKLMVTPNGVDLDLFDEAVDSATLRESLHLNGKVTIGFAGWFKSWHGIEFLIDAFQKAALDGKGGVLVLIGDGPRMPQIRSHVEKCGLGPFVIFSGPLSHDEIPAWLSLVDVAVQPAANEYCCPMKVIEYMAMRKAIVAPCQENITELLSGSEAALFKPNDLDDLARCLTKVVEDPTLRGRLGSAARRGLETRRLSWKANAELVVSTINH